MPLLKKGLIKLWLNKAQAFSQLKEAFTILKYPFFKEVAASENGEL